MLTTVLGASGGNRAHRSGHGQRPSPGKLLGGCRRFLREPVQALEETGERISALLPRPGLVWTVRRRQRQVGFEASLLTDPSLRSLDSLNSDSVPIIQAGLVKYRWWESVHAPPKAKAVGLQPTTCFARWFVLWALL